MDEQGANIHSLSVEILGHVLSWLNDDDLLSAASVSRHWFDVINRHLLRRKHSAIMRPDANDFVPDWRLEKLSLIGYDRQSFNDVHDICAGISKLHISYEDSTDRVLDDADLTIVLNSCGNLTEASFKNVAPSHSSLQTIQRYGFSKLKTLSFECQTTQLNEDQIETFFNHLYFPEVKLMTKSCRKTEGTDLHARYPFTFTNPINFIQVPTSITTLSLDCSGLSKDAFNCLEYCKKLESIVLLKSFRIEDEAVIMLSKLPQLNKISFTDSRKITTVGWTQLFSQTKISNISLIRCIAGLSDYVFKDMKAANRYLNVDLQSCKRVTKDGLSSLLRTPEQLYLSMDYNEEMLDHLVSIVNEELASRVRVLDISIQRIQATTATNSTHLNDVKNALASYSSCHNVQFSFRELFTRAEHGYRPISTT